MRVRAFVLGCSVLSACVLPAGAQWINHPTAGIPRTADGKPDLNAPAPRTAERHPDLTGMWSIGGLGAVANITDVAMLPWAEALYKERLDTYGHDDPAANCLPEGPRTGLAGLDPLRIVQTPTLIVVLYEAGPVRQIYLDGRPHPTDPTPTWMGYSVGTWDGDTLVVETTGFNDRTWLDVTGHPHSEALRVTERFRRTSFGAMELSITYDDPKTYARPWSITLPVFYLPDTDLLETVCLENEKDRPKLVGRVDDERRAAQTIDRNVLVGYVGSYDVGPLGVWQVRLDGDELRVQMTPGGARLPLIAQSRTRFAFHALGGTITFVPGADGVATRMVLTVVEGDFPAARQ
jgi:hypothetical protein